MPYFNRFDICEAYYMYACHYQASGYASGRPLAGRGRGRDGGDIFCRLARLQFRPGTTLRERDDPRVALEANGYEIYRALVARREGVIMN